MTKPIYTIHQPDADHLAEVRALMLTLGAPTIRVVECGDYLFALEGCHRIAAAHDLGLMPDLVVLEQDEEIDITGYDWYEPQNWAGTRYAAGEVVGELQSNGSSVYRFEAAE